MRQWQPMLRCTMRDACACCDEEEGTSGWQQRAVDAIDDPELGATLFWLTHLQLKFTKGHQFFHPV